jgi:hypothetical protein
VIKKKTPEAVSPGAERENALREKTRCFNQATLASARDWIGDAFHAACCLLFMRE